MNQKGIAHILLILIMLILVVGICIAVYLSQFTQVFKPKASENITPLKKDVQIWFAPNMYYAADDAMHRINPVDANTFWDDEEKLKNILPMLSSFGLQPADDHAYLYPKMQAMLKKYNVPVEMSIGGVNSFNSAYCDNHNAGELTASFEIETIRKIESQGIKIDILTMDDPISRTIAHGEYPTNCNYTVNESVQEVIDAMRAIHQVYPDKKIGMNVNFANWRYAGTQIWGDPARKNWDIADYKEVVDKLLPKIKASGEELTFLHADYPYEHAHPDPNPYPNVDWMKRLLDLEKQVKSYNVRFGVFFNSDGMNVSDVKEYTGVTKYVSEYRARGGSPDNYVLKSWSNYPQHMLPASEPYTYTYLLTTVMRMIDTPPVGSLDSIVACTTVVGWACDIDTPSKPIGVQFNADGKFIGYTVAEQSAEEGVALQCGGHNRHRFQFDLPPQLQDNKPHTLNIFAMNSNSFGQNTQLPGSPISMQCVKPSSSPSPSPVKKGDLSPTAGGDGNVDMADFNIFARYYKDKDLRADFNGDSDVTLADLNILIRNFGQ